MSLICRVISSAIVYVWSGTRRIVRARNSLMASSLSLVRVLRSTLTISSFPLEIEKNIQIMKISRVLHESCCLGERRKKRNYRQSLSVWPFTAEWFHGVHFKSDYHRFRWYATLEIKTSAETFPKFPSVLRVVDRSDRNPPITATSVTF